MYKQTDYNIKWRSTHCAVGTHTNKHDLALINRPHFTFIKFSHNFNFTYSLTKSERNFVREGRSGHSVGCLEDGRVSSFAAWQMLCCLRLVLRSICCFSPLFSSSVALNLTVSVDFSFQPDTYFSFWPVAFHLIFLYHNPTSLRALPSSSLLPRLIFLSVFPIFLIFRFSLLFIVILLIICGCPSANVGRYGCGPLWNCTFVSVADLWIVVGAALLLLSMLVLDWLLVVHGVHTALSSAQCVGDIATGRVWLTISEFTWCVATATLTMCMHNIRYARVCVCFSFASPYAALLTAAVL